MSDEPKNTYSIVSTTPQQLISGQPQRLNPEQNKPEKIRKERKEQRKLSKKEESVKLLIDNGMEPEKAITSLGYRGASLDSVKSRLKKYYVTHPQLLKKGKLVATKMLDDFIANKPYSERAALRLIEMQQDRIDPVINKHEIQQDSRSISITLDARAEMVSSLRKHGILPDVEGDKI